MKSLYGQYIQEKEGAHIIEDEKGFMVYKYQPTERLVHIPEIFVLPEFRNNGIGTSYLNILEDIIDNEKFDWIICSTEKEIKYYDENEKIFNKVGFRKYAEEDGKILFCKYIGVN